MSRLTIEVIAVAAFGAAAVASTFTPWPLVTGASLALLAGSVMAWKLRGRGRVVAANVAAMSAVLLGAELLAQSGLGRWSRPKTIPVAEAASLPRGVIPLLPTAELPALPPVPRPSRPEQEEWNETVDAGGLKVRTAGQMYSGPRNTRHFLIPGAVVRVQKLRGDDLIYDVVHTISRHGFRDTPRARAADGGSAALFFGCSYTFGEGVEDAETLPAQFERLGADVLGDAGMRAYNFGIPGGGAHEMLAILEEERERSAVGAERPLLAVYTALGDHPQRAMGEAGAWQLGRPRYELQNGVATRAGSFGDSAHPMPPAPAHAEAPCRSALLCRLSQGTQAPPEVSPDGIELWRALVRRSRDILRERYGIPLVTLVWHHGNGDAEALERAMVADGIPVVSTRTLLAINDPELRLVFDEHPNPRAHRLVAGALLQSIADGSVQIGLQAGAHGSR